MAHALRAWAINRGGKNSVRNLRYGPRTRLVRGIYLYFFQSMLSGGADSHLIIYDVSGGGWRTRDSDMEYLSADTT